MDTFSLKYEGIIINPQRKMKVAIINLYGGNFMVREREKVEGLMIWEIGKKYLVVVLRGKFINIK